MEGSRCTTQIARCLIDNIFLLLKGLLFRAVVEGGKSCRHLGAAWRWLIGEWLLPERRRTLPYHLLVLALQSTEIGISQLVVDRSSGQSFILTSDCVLVEPRIELGEQT